MPRVLITGATGFIGRRIMHDLITQGYDVIAALRSPAVLPRGVAPVIVGDLKDQPDWRPILGYVDAVIHTAAIAHTNGVSDDLYERINTQATLSLAHIAAEEGVARFIFLSSIRAQSGAVSERLLIEADDPTPTDAYGRSKLNAEEGLAQIHTMDWVALRPVLVYGGGVKGNMAALMRLVRWPLPLPFAHISAQRSLISLTNVSKAVISVLEYPHPLRCPLIVAEPEPLSIPEIIGALREGVGRAPLLFNMRQDWLENIAHVFGKRDMLDRMTGSLVADSSRLLSLGWNPDIDTRAQLSSMMAKIYKPQ
jgi:nucleoside-diphosphate-sugar epimerase